MDILFTEGIDESVDPRTAGPTRLIVARNVFQKQSGVYEKRPGTDQLSQDFTGYYDGTFTSGNIQSSNIIQTILSGTVGNYFMDDTRLYCFSSAIADPSTEKMVLLDQITEASADIEHLFESDNDITHGMDVSVYTYPQVQGQETKGVRVVAFAPAATTPAVWATVFDAAGVPLLGPTQLSSGGSNSRHPRVLICGTTAVVLWTDITTGQVKASKLDVTAPQNGWSAASALITLVGQAWDAAVKSSTTFSLVYVTTGSLLKAAVVTVSSLAVGSVSFGAVSAGTCIAMAVNVDAGSRVCGMYAMENAGTVTAYRQTFTTANPPVAADAERNTGISYVTGGGLNVQMSCLNMTGSTTDWFAMSGTLASQNNWATKWVGITSAGSVGTVRTTKAHYLGSRLIRQTAVNSGTSVHAVLVATRFFSTPGTSVGYYDGSYVLVNLEVERTSTEPYARAVARLGTRVLQPALVNQRMVPNLIFEIQTASTAQSYVTVGSTRFGASLASVRGGISLFRFTFGDPLSHHHVELRPGEWLVGGGVPSCMDGRLITEVSFECGPAIDTVTIGNLSGSLANGNYRYAAHWEWRNRLGSVDYSAPTYSALVAVSVGPFANVNTEWRGLPLSVKNDFDSGSISAVRLVVCRTLNLDSNPSSPYFRLYSDAYPAGTNVPNDGTNVSYKDTLSDTLLALNPLMYTTAAVENQCPPASRHVCIHKGRAILLGADNTLYFSRYITTGEVVAFNDSFTYPITDGKPYAVASNGELLVVFLKNKAYGISGEGPSDGGNGYDYSAPKLLTSEVGTDNWRSVVETEMGVFFASQSKGIYLLTKNQQVRWVGARVQKTFEAYPIVTSARVHPTLKLVLFSCTTTAYGNSVVLAYDMEHDIWTTWDYNISGEGNDHVRTMGKVGDTVYAIASGYLQKEVYTKCSDGLDYSQPNTQGWPVATVRTGWVVGEPNGHIILRRVRLHGEWVSNHGLSVSFYRNFGANIDGNAHNVDATNVGTSSLERLNFGPQYMRGQAFSVSISDTEVSSGGGTPPASFAAGFKLHSLTCDVIPIRGPDPRVAPTGQK